MLVLINLLKSAAKLIKFFTFIQIITNLRPDREKQLNISEATQIIHVRGYFQPEKLMRRKDRQVKNNSDIESIISRCDVCRIAFSDNNTPYIVTLNFGYHPGSGTCFYFHSAPEGRKIKLIGRNNYVCFEMDTDHVLFKADKGCDWGMKYSSVVGYGRITIVYEAEEKKRGLDCIMAHYSEGKDFTYDEKIMSKTTVLRLDIEEITGKQK